ncbi:MAG: hypothetical protein NVS4B2_35160 [Chloroflexota bacterium]
MSHQMQSHRQKVLHLQPFPAITAAPHDGGCGCGGRGASLGAGTVLPPFGCTGSIGRGLYVGAGTG